MRTIEEAQGLNIEITDRAVSVKGERKSKSTSEEGTRSELYYGSFRRVIPMSVRVQNTDVQAEYKDGV